MVAEYSAARGNDLQAQLTFTNGESEAFLIVEQETPYLTVDVSSLEFSDEGGYSQVYVKSNISWKASATESWVKFNYTNEVKGSATLTITADPADTEQNTSCTATISGGGLEHIISITRKGYIRYAFAVSETKRVTFSKSNLQYNPSTNTWRFAPDTYSYIGADNSKAKATYDGWLDVFNWGANGIGAPAYTISDYCGIDGWMYNTEIDWGHNVISGESADTYYTMTYAEWNYLIKKRNNADKLYSIGMVNGVCGLILLPDHFKQPAGTTFKAGGTSYSSNVITATDWNKWAMQGAVFLPAAGNRDKNGYHELSQSDNTHFGAYWTSSSTAPTDYTGAHRADAFGFGSTGECFTAQYTERNTGRCVRLVKVIIE